MISIARIVANSYIVRRLVIGSCIIIHVRRNARDSNRSSALELRELGHFIYWK